jgi:type II secretory pathway predicted ATPase ExeA
VPVALSTTLTQAARKLGSNNALRIWTFLEKFFSDPSHPSLNLERITKAKESNLWSGRVSDDLRAVIYKDGDLWTVLHVDHHDAAYDWAKTRTVERHIKTGSLQVVVAPEVVAPIVQADATPTSQPDLFAQYPDDYLLSLGLPPTWVTTIRQVRSKEVLLNTVLELPEEVAERLLDLAEGGFVTPPVPLAEDQPAIASPDTRRRFYVLDSNQDLLKLLDAPLATWIAFLHPSQQQLAIGTFKGVVKVTGAAGTGKTVVGLHRARHLAQQGKQVLLTSYVTTLCHNLERNLQLLCTPEERSRITVSTVHKQAKELLNQAGQSLEAIDDDDIKKLIEKFHTALCPLGLPSLYLEWEIVIQAQGITTWDAYRTANRAGRGQPLTVKDRKQVWQVFEQVLKHLQSQKQSDWSGICRYVHDLLREGKIQSPYDSVIVDELQDLRPQEIRLLAALAGEGTDRLMLLGDAGQQIFTGRTNLKSLGIDVRGRSHILRINYRTTEQIRSFADRIAGNQTDDLDGNIEHRKATISLLSGPEPTACGFNTQPQQLDFVSHEVKKLWGQGLALDEIAIFARTNNELNSIEECLKATKIPSQRLSREADSQPGAINLGTMHRAKGLEFKVVFVINVSDNQMPLIYLVNQMPDAPSREAALKREQQLLYVSVTRARDEVFATWVGQPSRFLEEILTRPSSAE